MPPAIIGLPGVILEDPMHPKAQQVTTFGLVRLVFSSVTAGTMAPDLDSGQVNPTLPSGEKFPFSGYKQVWNAAAQTLRVSFTVKFKPCAASVVALFRATP
jgi:hypothetical protein